MEYLSCIFCQKKYPLDLFNLFCPECQEPLICSSPKKKRTFSLEKSSPLEKFSDFLPLTNINLNLSLGEGNTPLIMLNRLMKFHNLPPVFVKNEISNPTASFKDRGTAIAIQKAVSMGIERIGTVSTGNMAISTAAYGAKAGLKTFVFLKEDISSEKLLSAGMFDPVLVKIKGDYGELYYKSFSIGKKFNIFFINSVNAFRIAGYKVTGLEIFIQLNMEIPHYIFVPVSSGGHLIGLMSAFLDLKEEGLIPSIPTFVGVQAKGCSPIAQAYVSGKSKVTRIKKGVTIAHSISNPDPPGGNLALKLIQENDGILTHVTDSEILEAQKALAEFGGIFCQPASATTLAGLFKLREKLKLNTKDKIVLVITGSGLKAIKALEAFKIGISQSSLSNLDETLESLLDRETDKNI